MADFVVVGGGIGGLVVARELVLGGADVTLLEESDRLGGTIGTHVVGGIELDSGAESFATRGGTVAALATSLGLGDAIVEPNPEGAWLQTERGDAHPLPKNSLLGIPGSPLAEDVTAVIGGAAGFRAFIEALLPGTYAAKSPTLGELVRRRMGDAVLEQLVAPVVRGVHSAEPDDLDLDRVAPGLRAAMRRTGSLARAVLDLRATSARAGSAVAGIDGGIHRIVDALVSDLERFGVTVQTGTRVTAIEPDHVFVGDERIDGRIVVAAPGLGAVPDAVRSPDRRVVLATLVVDQPALDSAPRGTGVLVAAGSDGVTAKALTHATAKWEWLAREAAGRHVLRLSYDVEPADLEATSRSDAARLLGVELSPSAVLGFARVEWYRPAPESHTPSGISWAGETASRRRR